jgi:hypothetical protein
MNSKERRELIYQAHRAWYIRGRDHWVYKAYGAGGELLYVGCTYDREDRWATHRRLAPWAQLAHRFVQIGPFSKAKGFALEAQIIFAEQPAFNVRGKKSAPRRAA